MLADRLAGLRPHGRDPATRSTRSPSRPCLFFALFSVLSIRERRWFWMSRPSSLLHRVHLAAGRCGRHGALDGRAPGVDSRALARDRDRVRGRHGLRPRRERCCQGRVDSHNPWQRAEAGSFRRAAIRQSRRRAMTFRRVLIALDSSAIAAHALEVGLGLAQALGAEVALVYVVDPKLAVAPEAGIPAATLMAEAKREGAGFARGSRGPGCGPLAAVAVPARGSARQGGHHRGPGVGRGSHPAGYARTIGGGAGRPRQHRGGGAAARSLPGGRGSRSACRLIAARTSATSPRRDRLEERDPGVRSCGHGRFFPRPAR